MFVFLYFGVHFTTYSGVVYSKFHLQRFSAPDILALQYI